LVGIFQPKFAVPFFTNRLFALIREFGRGIEPFLLVGPVYSENAVPLIVIIAVSNLIWQWLVNGQLNNYNIH